MSEIAESLGARLKAERERRGMSAAKAADELHLDSWAVEALEAEDYGRVGPSVYAKGHLKRYAALLGLPVDEILAGYDRRAQLPKAVSAPALNVHLDTAPPPISGLPWPQVLGALAALLLLAAVLWWKPWHERAAAPLAAATATAPAESTGAAGADGAETAPPESPAVAVPAALPGAALVSTSPASAEQSAATPSEVTAGAGRARLRLSFSADSWVDIHDAAGRRVFAGKGRANSVKVVHGVAPMRVYLGFASGVQLEINDRAVAIRPQFVAGDVARFEAGADGVLRRDSHGSSPARPPG